MSLPDPIAELREGYRGLREELAKLARLVAPVDEQRAHLEAHKEIEERLAKLEAMAPNPCKICKLDPCQCKLGRLTDQPNGLLHPSLDDVD